MSALDLTLHSQRAQSFRDWVLGSELFLDLELFVRWTVN